MSQNKMLEELVHHAGEHFSKEVVHHAAHEEKHTVGSAVCVIVVGLFLVPALVGVPLLFWGVYKLIKACGG